MHALVWSRSTGASVNRVLQLFGQGLLDRIDRRGCRGLSFGLPLGGENLLDDFFLKDEDVLNADTRCQYGQIVRHRSRFSIWERILPQVSPTRCRSSEQEVLARRQPKQ